MCFPGGPPHWARPRAWHPEIDSYDPDRATGPQAQDRRQAGERVTVGPRSVVVLSGPVPQAPA